MALLPAETFQQAVLTWYEQWGRKNLPWQQPRTPYGVWISEIMLQQTQVNTVLPYFQRFIAQYPTLAHLAAASEDDVLHLWTGLGYYSRARNLWRCAQLLTNQYDSKFPSTVEALCALPGIGASTAGAILSLGLEIPAPILDGNVKRVLCRHHAITGWPGKTAVHKQLWHVSTHYTPKNKTVVAYNQGMMDLGALLCTRSNPQCTLCPLQTTCQGYQQGNAIAYPEKKPKKTLPERYTTVLMLYDNQQRLLLEKRPPVGIWGGLWSFPEYALDTDWQAWCEDTYHCNVQTHETWPTFRHTFSHYHLHITPILVHITHKLTKVREEPRHAWCPIDDPQHHQKGLPAPIKQCWQQLKEKI
ncbi:MAG: A/G-specific adenine glycosylase [Gammaproteobacteria bacterium]